MLLNHEQMAHVSGTNFHRGLVPVVSNGLLQQGGVHDTAVLVFCVIKEHISQCTDIKAVDIFLLDKGWI